MSDKLPPGLPRMPPLMDAEHARDIGRLHQGLAELYEETNGAAQATRERQKAQWWLTYSIALAQTKEEPNP